MADVPFIILPLDGRPVCYDQVMDLASIGKIPVVLPPKSFLGVLKRPAPMDLLLNWWEQSLDNTPQAHLIFSLDTMAYGGLIASRVNTEKLPYLKDRVQTFLKSAALMTHQRYGFSSILRIPNYNNAEEEPDYWSTFGKILYQFSAETHQQGSFPSHFFNQIPGPVIQDFLDRREKNFYLNESFIDLIEQGLLDFLIFCQDDTGPYGLNVQEAETLKRMLAGRELQSKSVVQTGADEAALTLMARALWTQNEKPLKVFPWFFPQSGKKVMAKFDGIAIGAIVQRHIQTIGGVMSLSPLDADFILMVNCPRDEMGDHCVQQMSLRPKSDSVELVEALRTWLPQKDVSIADVVYANGGDSVTLQTMLKANIPFKKLSGYAAWNTPGNSIGTALAMGAIVAWAKQHKRLDDTAKQRLLFKRFLDDWYYQAEARIRLRKLEGALLSEDKLTQEMKEGLHLLKPKFELPSSEPTFTFPCDRLFEISVQL